MQTAVCTRTLVAVKWLTWTRWLPFLAARLLSQARGSTVDVSILQRLLRRRTHSQRSSGFLKRVTCIGGTVTHTTKVYEFVVGAIVTLNRARCIVGKRPQLRVATSVPAPMVALLPLRFCLAARGVARRQCVDRVQAVDEVSYPLQWVAVVGLFLDPSSLRWVTS